MLILVQRPWRTRRDSPGTRSPSRYTPISSRTRSPTRSPKSRKRPQEPRSAPAGRDLKQLQTAALAALETAECDDGGAEGGDWEQLECGGEQRNSGSAAAAKPEAFTFRARPRG
eukprot:5693529-Prymnesium_polylepis.2